jgi:TonB dependent receptor.
MAFPESVVYDGSFVIIKQIQLGYSIPKQLLKKVCVYNVRLYASLDDFFTFTNYPAFDPEASVNCTLGMGVDKGAYPSSKYSGTWILHSILIKPIIVY